MRPGYHGNYTVVMCIVPNTSDRVRSEIKLKILPFARNYSHLFESDFFIPSRYIHMSTQSVGSRKKLVNYDSAIT